jgi:uncharacterized zinc-type alcohol dehydrogenase-like protein
MSRIRAWAAPSAAAPLEAFSFDPGPLGPDEVEIAVETCGLCHSDLSLINDEWGMSAYPLVAGHEVIGRVVELGSNAKGLSMGQRVGVGWNSQSCMFCRQCMGGDHNLCKQAQPTAVGHYGGFAERVRAQWPWVLPIPERLDAQAAGPLLCGGITVFNPLLILGIKPTDRVGVVGIGGLGHMALKFARAWGCEVTAFTSSASKSDEARSLGAHHVVSSRDPDAMKGITGSLDLVLSTVNVPMDWPVLMSTLAPNGKLHMVGAVKEPIPVSAIPMIFGQNQISGSPTGSPAAMATMLDFAARHQIAPMVEYFPMSQLNQALHRLREGKARYRIVLTADFN